MSRDPHVCLVALTGFRIREPDMLALGMTSPALHDRAMAVAALPALGLLTLAAWTPEPWSQSFHDPAAVDDALIEAILAHAPTLVAVSALTPSSAEAYRLADALRLRGVHTVLGGLHATSCPDEALQHFGAVCVSDGEPVWQDILAAAASGTLHGVYKAAGPFDLATSRVPRFDLLGPRQRPRFTLQTARGCPLACDFCGASRMLGPFREKPAPLVARELDALRTLARRPIIELADDNTFAGGRDASELLTVLERAHVRYFTECDWRIGERPEILDRLAASGCVQVLVGLESLAPRHAGMGAKKAEFGRMMNAVGRIQDAGVAVIGCFVVGADGEDHESLAALGEFLMEAPLADVQITVQTPFPGTALHKRLKREGRLRPDRGWESYTLFDVVHTPDRLSAEQLQSGFYNVVRMAFAEGPVAQRIQRRREIWARRGVAI
jgi:radical SAM superfamily enzyme YgiQ (UPF0313 family)